MTPSELGTENIVWDLSVMYSSPDDPELTKDVESLEALMIEFKRCMDEDMVSKDLPQILEKYQRIRELCAKIQVYLFLAFSTNQKDERLKCLMESIERKISFAWATNMTSFANKICQLDEETLALYHMNGRVSHHSHFLTKIREDKPHILADDVECAITKREPFGPEAWSTFCEQVESGLVIEIDGKPHNLEEAMHVMTEDADAEKRAQALHAINETLGKDLVKVSAQTLNVVVGYKSIEDRDRGYSHPMQAKNKSNGIPDSAVVALHKAVKKTASPLARRFYTLKARLLGQETLKWSDRNAKVLSGNDPTITYNKALDLVLAAYESFSPLMAEVIRSQILAKRRIHAPSYSGKRSGAYNYSGVLPEDQVVSFVFLNFLGSSRDVMTLAHELGHAIHGILAGLAQGVLMQHAPIACAETASIFGEMISFNHLLSTLSGDQHDLARLALLIRKIDDMLNCIVRQIGFSNFEQAIHAASGPLTPLEYSELWMNSIYELYGNEGEVFTFADTSNLWSYISHFHTPFYVYGYASSELVVQSLAAVCERVGRQVFEPMYLQLLRAGSSKPLTDLLQPFGLDPSDQRFWTDGIEISLGKMIAQAEALYQKLKDSNRL